MLMTEKPGAETGAQDDDAPHTQSNESVVEEITVSPVRAVLRARRLEIVLGIGLCLYSILAVLAHIYAYFSWDLRLARLIQSIDFPGFDSLMIWTSFLGNGWAPWVLTFIISIVLALLRLKLEGVICLISAGAGALLDRVMKIVIARPRPDDAIVQVMGNFKHESFPSGHVFFYVSFFGFLFFLAYVLLKRIPLRRILLVILAGPLLLVGVSRVYMGAHWPSDVIGAYLAGGVWLMIMIELYRRLKAQPS
jgi:undecaprenyl-diphosphatase